MCYARVEKVPGGEIEQSKVLNGVMLNKHITHPRMRRRVIQPRIILLDSPLEYKKGENQMNMEFSKELDGQWAQDIEFKPDLLIMEKGYLVRSHTHF
jgi:T-complex protein 1 subunit gamma